MKSSSNIFFRPLRRLLLRGVAFAGLLLFSAHPAMPAAVRTAPQFAHQASDLPPDPATRFGTLPNGLRYVVRPNAEPKNRASLRLVVLAGSLMETENQRGLAHFLEHLAFNGSRHYPDGSLVETLQRLGMGFGADTNAHTSYDQTVYKLELPNAEEVTVAQGIRIFSDFASGLDLSPEKIEKERGIVLAEKRDRDSPGFRASLAELEFFLDGTLIPKRSPIGVEEVIKRAPRADILEYYNVWYRPDRMAVVAVGDFDPVKVEALIIAGLSSLAPRSPMGPDPVLGDLPVAEGVRAGYHHNPEAGLTQIVVSTLCPVTFEPDTSVKRLKELPRNLALSMVNRRLNTLSMQEDCPFVSAGASIDQGFDFYRRTLVTARCQPAQWKNALGAIEREMRRAFDHGFLPAELKEAKADLRNRLEEAAKASSTRQSAMLANQIYQTIITRQVFDGPAEALALLGPALERVTVEDCAAALRTLWSETGRTLFVSGNLSLPKEEAAALIKEAYLSSRSVPVTATDPIAEQKFAYGDFGPPGKVVARQEVADLDVTLVEFSNGVRLNLKKTGFEKNRVYFSIRFGGGSLTQPRDQPGLGMLADLIFTPGGLGQHSVDELQHILAGRSLSAPFSVGGDAFNYVGLTNPGDLLLQCQFLTAFLTDPGYRPEAMRQATKHIEQFYTSLKHDIGGPLRTDAIRLLGSGDSRFGLPAKEALASRTVEEVKAWLAPQLARGAIEIAVVGDLDIESTIAIVARTFGALPKREPKPAFTAERQARYPAEPITKTYHVDTQIPKGNVALYWPATDAFDAPLSRRLDMLARVFGDRLRLRLREQMGEAYSPVVGTHLSEDYPGYGYFYASASVEPEKAAAVAEAIRDVATDLAAHGVTADELSRAKQPVLTALRQSQRSNLYWVSTVLASAQEFPRKLEWSRTRLSDFEAITATELSALAAQYLSATRASQFTCLPEAKAK